MSEIRVSVFKPGNRPNFVVQWKDPVTGRKKTRSTGQVKKRDAERWASKFERELNAGELALHRTTWEEFRERYEAEVVPGMKSAMTITTVFNRVEEIISPKLLSAVDARQISKMVQRLRELGNTEATIANRLRTLKAALRWAASMGMIAKAPKIVMPRRTKGMKGRPITAEEFDRMIAKVEAVVGAEQAAQWAFLLRGLWFSGLRLSEALELDWIDDRRLCVDFSGRYPMFRIQADAEKGGKSRILPMAPEFAELLRTVPEAEREGRVFKVPFQKQAVGKSISRIGKAAGVKVKDFGDGKLKHATAHDLRRAFGLRWSSRIMPNRLQELMRHEHITTTMEFYVGQDADATAEAIWATVANHLANGADSNQDGTESAKTVSHVQVTRSN